MWVERPVTNPKNRWDDAQVEFEFEPAERKQQVTSENKQN